LGKVFGHLDNQRIIAKLSGNLQTRKHKLNRLLVPAIVNETVNNKQLFEHEVESLDAVCVKRL
jgi:hypothetical protein